MKKVIIAGAVAAVIIAIITYNKVIVYTDVVSKLKMWPTKLKKLEFIEWNQPKITVDIAIQNPTGQPLSVSTGNAATIKKIILHYDNTFIGAADINMSGIDIQPYGTTAVSNVGVVVDALSLLMNIASSNLSLSNINLEKLRVTALIDVLGREYQI